jgi:membrane-associated phospholipid phosphatase
MPLIILGYLFIKKMYVEIDKTMLFFFITYYGSYLLYFAVPALGPRFYEPLVELQKVPLDGLLLTDIIRDTISSLEHNKFDAFPSLHTAISLATVIIIGQYRKKWLYFFIPILIGIFISLIYCRYHYFIDIIGGVVWTLISFWIVEKYYDKVFSKYFAPFYS